LTAQLEKTNDLFEVESFQEGRSKFVVSHFFKGRSFSRFLQKPKESERFYDIGGENASGKRGFRCMVILPMARSFLRRETKEEKVSENVFVEELLIIFS